MHRLYCHEGVLERQLPLHHCGRRRLAERAKVIYSFAIDSAAGGNVVGTKAKTGSDNQNVNLYQKLLADES